MENTFLQSFLKTGLFEIGDNDTRLENLENSINDLKEKLSADFSLIPKYTLVALDSEVSDDEPVFSETEIIVSEHWKTLRTKYAEMPRQLLRGVILNALYLVGKEDSNAARIIYLTAFSFFPYSKLGKERKNVEEMLDVLSEIAETHAVEEWSLIEKEPSLKLSTIKIKDFSFGEVKIDETKLEKKLYASIQNTSTGHGTQHGGSSNWGKQYSELASEGIAEAFDSAIEEFNKSLTSSTLETPINKFFKTFKKSLDETLKNSFSSLTAIERRSKLLWWKETLYSSSLKGSYRDETKIKNRNALPLIMAIDLFHQLPKVTPASVDFLLKDTLYLLNENKEIETKFSDYLKSISEQETKDELKSYFIIEDEIQGRISISQFIGFFIHDKVQLNDFKKRTGVSIEENISISNLSIAILHDFLTQRLIAN